MVFEKKKEASSRLFSSVNNSQKRFTSSCWTPPPRQVIRNTPLLAPRTTRKRLRFGLPDVSTARIRPVRLAWSPPAPLSIDVLAGIPVRAVHFADEIRPPYPHSSGPDRSRSRETDGVRRNHVSRENRRRTVARGRRHRSAGGSRVRHAGRRSHYQR